MSSTNPIQDRLRAMGIHNGRQLAKHVEAPAAIYFLVHSDEGHEDPRAELHFTEHGTAKTETFRADPGTGRSISRVRANCVQQAKDWAAENIEQREWRRAAFTHCWLPASSIEKIQAELAD